MTVATVVVRKRRKPGPPLPAGWTEAYLLKVREHGGLNLAAEQAGVNLRTVQRLRNADDGFDQRVCDALELYADTLEHEMVQQAKDRGNPVGYIVRLKALRPDKYIERHAIMNLNVSVDATPADALGLLARMVGASTEATRKALTATEGTVVPDEGSEVQ